MYYRYLFFDTETTGTDHEWDNIVQLAAIMTDDIGNQLHTINCIIKPDGFTIPKEATTIHGISQAKAMKEGIPITEALQKFLDMALDVNCAVAHNYFFDFSFLMEELIRKDMDKQSDLISKLPFHCTMRSTTEFCKLSYNAKHKTYKWPKLKELYYELFKSTFDGAHNALVDVEATIKCFFELKQKHGFYQPNIY